MNRQKELYRREDLEMMTSLQLDEVLCAELEKEFADRNVVLGILEILEGRESGMPLPEHPKVTEAKALYRGWNEGASFERENKPKKKHWIAKAAVIAVVLLTFSVTVPKALGAESLFDLLASWTESIFAFFRSEATEATPYEARYAFQTDNPGLQELYDTVTELGVTQAVIPQWLPEGYELEEIQIHEMRGCVKIHARFIRESQEISISIRIFLDDYDVSYHKDKLNVEIYEFTGVPHYIMNNETITKVVWNVENVECIIRIEQQGVLHQIIESVYSEE